MSVGKNSQISYPYALGDFKIGIESTRLIREALLNKNLDGSYLNRGSQIPDGGQKPGSVVVENPQVFSVKASKSPEEGTDINGIEFKKTQFLVNKYGPDGGYGNPLSVNVVNLVKEAQLQYISPNTVQPQGFITSNYTAIEVLNSIRSTNGQKVIINSEILDDSILINSSLPYLKDNLGFNIAQFDFNVSEKGSAKLNVTTKPGMLIPEKSDYLTRLSGNFSPDSTIPGYYTTPSSPPNINSIAGQGANNISQVTPSSQSKPDTSGLPNAPLNISSPSDKFIEYMGKDQQSLLFSNLNYNVFRPDYSEVKVDSSVEKPLSNYYVGSKNTDPGLIQSPIDATPKDVFGKQIQALVYGPSEVYKEFANVDGRALWRYYNFGPLGVATTDGGSLEGGFTWFGKKIL